MANIRLCITVVLCLTLAAYTHGYSSGGPDGACERMTPAHGVAPQTSQPQYKVTTSKTSLAPGDMIDVTVSGGGQFKGFFIRARQNGNFVTGGQFQDHSLGNLRCGGSGITHNSPTSKDSITVTWKAPDNLDSSPVQFVATVVQERVRYWTLIPAADVAVSGAATGTSGGGNTTPSTGSGGQMPPTTPRSQGGKMDDDDDDDDDNGGGIMKNPGKVVVDPECGKTKGCYHDCRPGGRCSYFISWLYDSDGQTVLFNFLYQSTSRYDQWLALGLSHDLMMGDDSVMECVMDGGRVLVKVSYNDGKNNVYPDDKHAGITDYGGSINNGVLGCSFRRKISYPREPAVFDLNQPYYLMVANGEAVSGNKFPHSYERPPKVSEEKISFQHTGTVRHGLDPLYPMVKTHGTAMTLAWMFFSSTGVFIARHGREMFNHSKPCGIHVWFHIHRFCMAMSAFLTTAGFVLILIESKGYSHIADTPSKSYRTLHPPLGLLLLILTLVNPLMAIFRPDHKSPSRPLFKWTHWGCGMLAWVLSMALLLIGLDLTKSQADVESIYVVFAFLAYQLVIEILVRALPYVLGGIWGYFKRSCGRSKRSYDFNMTEFSTNEVASVTGRGITPNKDLADKEHKEDLRRENVIKSAILVFHIFASACFAIAVLYFLLRRPVDYIPESSHDKVTVHSEDDNTVWVKDGR